MSSKKHYALFGLLPVPSLLLLVLTSFDVFFIRAVHVFAFAGLQVVLCGIVIKKYGDVSSDSFSREQIVQAIIVPLPSVLLLLGAFEGGWFLTPGIFRMALVQLVLVAALVLWYSYKTSKTLSSDTSTSSRLRALSSTPPGVAVVFVVLATLAVLIVGGGPVDVEEKWEEELEEELDQDNPVTEDSNDPTPTDRGEDTSGSSDADGGDSDTDSSDPGSNSPETTSDEADPGAPELELVDVEVRHEYGFQAVSTVNFTLENTGDAPAENMPYEVEIDNSTGIGLFIINGPVEPGETVSVSDEIRHSVDGENRLRIAVEYNDETVEHTEQLDIKLDGEVSEVDGSINVGEYSSEFEQLEATIMNTGNMEIGLATVYIEVNGEETIWTTIEEMEPEESVQLSSDEDSVFTTDLEEGQNTVAVILKVPDEEIAREEITLSS